MKWLKFSLVLVLCGLLFSGCCCEQDKPRTVLNIYRVDVETQRAPLDLWYPWWEQYYWDEKE
jgi:hypothetical protein